MKIPVITTAPVPTGPNGPLMPEIHQNAPGAIYVPRTGEISAWDNKDFSESVAAGDETPRMESKDRGAGFKLRLGPSCGDVILVCPATLGLIQSLGNPLHSP